MSFKAEFGWAIRPFEYVHLTIEGATIAEFDSELQNLSSALYEELAQKHRNGNKIISNEDSRARAIPNPQSTVTAQQLIQSELGGTVISETVNPDQKPWERAKPATTPVNLF